MRKRTIEKLVIDLDKVEEQNEEIKKLPSILLKLKNKTIDVVKIIAKYCWITTDDTDGNSGSEVVRLVPNEAQIKLLRVIADMWNAGIPIRIIILKARQMGFSTIIEAFIFVVTMFQPHQKAVIVADCEENASSLFEMSKQYYEYFEEGILPTLKRSNKLIIETAKTKSSIRILCASAKTGRSKSLQFLHLSELAFWDDTEATLTSLLRTVKATNKKSAIFIESTANGFNAFKNRWDKAVAGDSPYTPLFFAWFEKKSYRLPYDGHPLSPEEIALKEKYGLDNDQLQWRRYQIADMDGDINRFHQEYPSCPEEAFISTGNSVFPNELLAAQKGKVPKRAPKRGYFTYHYAYSRDGSEVKITDIKWVDDPYGEISILMEPLKGFPYVLGGDPANGGADSFAGVVIDSLTNKVCAVYEKVAVDPDLYAFQLYCLGKYYNTALIGTEVNIAPQVMTLLAKCNYPKLYMREKEDTVTGGITMAYGVRTTTVTKPIMVGLGKAAVRENPSILTHYGLICEMETFVVVDTASQKNTLTTTRAVEGQHDDLVMAFLIALYIKSQSDYEIAVEAREESLSDWVNRSIESEIKQRKAESEWGSYYT